MRRARVPSQVSRHGEMFYKKCQNNNVHAADVSDISLSWEIRKVSSFAEMFWVSVSAVLTGLAFFGVQLATSVFLLLLMLLDFVVVVCLNILHSSED